MISNDKVNAYKYGAWATEINGKIKLQNWWDTLTYDTKMELMQGWLGDKGFDDFDYEWDELSLTDKIEIYEENKMKGENNMEYIEVIIFDKEAQEVVYRKEHVARGSHDAELLAVQEFGKYNPEIHDIITRNLFCFTPLKKEK